MGRDSAKPVQYLVFLAWSLLLSFFLVACDNNSHTERSSTSHAARPHAQGYCPLQEIRPSLDGKRRLALVTGVGQFQSASIPALAGPAADARRFYDLLTQENGYGFPEENVCLLTDTNASLASFRTAFKTHLLERIKPGDIITIYYAGLGSQSLDRNGDEPDFWDETLLFHDARTSSTGELLDDEFHQMLTQLHEITSDITVLLDTCNKAIQTRADDRYKSRCHAAATTETLDVTDSGDGSRDWLKAEAFPGLRLLVASTGRAAALERDGRGLFTDALISSMAPASDKPLSYAQLAAGMRQLIAAESTQQPGFYGDLQQSLFGSFIHEKPVSWVVEKLSPRITLTGPPIPGLGVGAEMRIYPAAATGSETTNPAKAKATIVINQYDGITAGAHIVSMPPIALSIMPGDLAVLVRPADRFLKLNVSLRPTEMPDGVSGDLASDFESELTSHLDALNTLRFVRKRGAYEVSVAPHGGFYIRGPENRIRNHTKDIPETIDRLWRHARHRAIGMLSGEGGSDFSDQQSLKVQLVPVPDKTACNSGVWRQSPPNALQIIPFCQRFQVKVTLDQQAGSSLLVGGMVMSQNGRASGLPADGSNVLLHPGDSYIFDGKNETFKATAQLDPESQVMIFGSKATTPVPWHLLNSRVEARNGYKTGLYRALDRYLTPGSRGVSLATSQSREESWTLSSLPFRVETNAAFDADEYQGNPHESGNSSFDLRPYLPDEENSPLYKLLQTVDQLTINSLQNNYDYRPHNWSKSSDEENLKTGIDSSRALWFVYTRTHLPFNRDNRYLTTAQMTEENSLMTDQFESCEASAGTQLGDILVYRDDLQNDGLALMVIDPEKLIAWGSNGLDGNALEPGVDPERSLEYQHIRFRRDWKKLGRDNMSLRACWRYRPFSRYAMNRGPLGNKALQQACTQQCRRSVEGLQSTVK